MVTAAQNSGMSRVVHMTYAVGMGPLPDLLEAQGGSRAVDRAFKAVGLPLDLVTDRHQRVPLGALIELFEQAARLAGDPLFGLRVGSGMQPTDYGLWVRYALQAPTLRGAIERLARTTVLHQVGGRVVLVERPNKMAVWRYQQVCRIGMLGEQHNDHVMPPMLGVARSYLGADWLPNWIETGCFDRKSAAAREGATGMSWRAGAEGLALVFDASALDRRRPAANTLRDEPISSADVKMELRKRTAERPIDRVAAIIGMRLMDRQCDIDGAALMAGLGRRSLQRMIEDEGTTYRSLLDRIRMSRALALIRETDCSLTDIAFMTGYSDPAHFSRAFKRLFGIAPSSYRSSCLTSEAMVNGASRSVDITLQQSPTMPELAGQGQP